MTGPKDPRPSVVRYPSREELRAILDSLPGRSEGSPQGPLGREPPQGHPGQRPHRLKDRPRDWGDRAPSGIGFKGVLLYVLPLPLLIGAAIALGSGSLEGFLGDGGGYALLTGGAWLHRRGLRAERAVQRVRFARLPRWPLRTLAGVLTALGTGIAAYFGADHGLPISLAFAGLAALGFHLAYGFEPLARPQPFDLSDERARAVARSLAEAEGRLLEIERAARAIGNLELKTRIGRIAAQGRGILEQIAERPTDLFRARKFLNVYLEGVQQVATGYARTHGRTDTGPDAGELDRSFRSVLVTVEQVFEEQRQKLLKTDLMDLDVQIEVLKRQLEREGIA